jgi:Fe-S oxidoreductase
VPRTNGAHGSVILWPDTFNDNFFPHTAQAATEVLERAGFHVHVPQQHLCCGRPLYDYGMLDTAKKYLERILQALAPQIEAGVPVVVLEPSCASVFRDELHGLMPTDSRAQKLQAQTFLLSEFLEQKAPEFKLPRVSGKALVQGHCHHKSVLHFDAEDAVLKKLGLDAEVLASGCCGMAGSFGFEKDKYPVSVAIGERDLLPRVRGASLSELIVADGFSCREQIAQRTPRQALHLAEVIQIAHKTEQRLLATRPEQEIYDKHRAALRRSRRNALAVLAVAGSLTLLLRSRRH